MNGNDIEHVQTSTHAPSVERFIRTLQDNLCRRLDGLKQNKSDWVKHFSSILTKYNNTEHNTTNIKPLDAVEKENHLWVNLHLQNNSKTNAGNTLRLMKVIWLELISENKFAKGHEPNWSSTRYKVVGIKSNQ